MTDAWAAWLEREETPHEDREDWTKPGELLNVSASPYLVCVRSKFDPSKLEAARGFANNALGRHETNLKLRRRPVSDWWRPIMGCLEEHGPATFNELCLRLVARTADCMAGTNLEGALWGLVFEGYVIHTHEAPVLFKVTEQRLLFDPLREDDDNNEAKKE